jgi:hypothetical protein
MLRTALFALVLTFAAGAAEAQLRTIPPDAKRAKVKHVQGMTIAVDGKTAQLSAGAQIRDAENRVMVPTALTAESLAKVQLNPQGQVHRVWLLTPFEAAQPDPKPAPKPEPAPAPKK